MSALISKEGLVTSGGGAYKPARVGLQRALEAGHMRNPLQMRHLVEDVVVVGGTFFFFLNPP